MKRVYFTAESTTEKAEKLHPKQQQAELDYHHLGLSVSRLRHVTCDLAAGPSPEVSADLIGVVCRHRRASRRSRDINPAITIRKVLGKVDSTALTCVVCCPGDIWVRPSEGLLIE